MANIRENWSVESIYSDPSKWEEDFARIKKEGWDALLQRKGQLSQSSKYLKESLDAVFSIARQLDKMQVYVSLKRDENLGDSFFKSAADRASTLCNTYFTAIAWVEPEILTIDPQQLEKWREGDLKEYDFYLQVIIDRREHTLSDREEALLASSQDLLDLPETVFSALSNVDLQFPKVTDSKGVERELTNGTYQSLIKDEDRLLRESAFKKLHGTYKGMSHAFCELLQGTVKGQYFIAKARKYNSCLDAALSPKHIDLAVYHALISSVRGGISALHEYTALRKELMKVDQLHFWDLSVSLVPQSARKFTFEEAANIAVDSVAILGKEYQDRLRRGLFEDGWVDVYEKKGKRSGAYSSGCYDSHPFILMNFQGELNDVMTLCHELGHSMNTFLSNQARAYHEARYTIFTAEVASTFNEHLAYKLLLERATTREERLYIIQKQLDGLRATFFRQTMFAEFELKIHSLVEEGKALTTDLMESEYKELNRAYFGSAITLDEEIAFEFYRVPHFHYNFYVYQYATSVAASFALIKRVENGDRESYLRFLSAGGDDYPVNQLRLAGIDVKGPELASALIDEFRRLTALLKKELG